jgi:Outer membrane protein beta-barrel domain
MTARVWTVGTWMCAAAFSLINPVVALAQETGGLGIGPRLTFIRGAEGSPDGAQRFSGAVVRFGSGKTAVELAMDYRSGVTGDLTERIKDYPIQGSLLVYPVRARVAPYLLAGIGWYSQQVERFSGTGSAATLVEGETTRKMGYHGGVGAELRLHRHFGMYGDYRYTMIGFGNQSTPPPATATPFPGWIPFAERLKLSHEGSMWTLGANFYF